MIGFLNWGGECLLRGTPWVLILDRMLFVFKGLNHLSSASSTSLRSGFRNRFIFRSVLFKLASNLVQVFQIVVVVEFTRRYSQHTSAFLFPFSISRITLTFLSTLRTFLLFVTLATLWRHQSPGNCRSRNIGSTLCTNYCNFPGLEFT
jgi:hypothetical protein